MSASLFKAELPGGAHALVYVELNADEDLFHAAELVKASIGEVRALTHVGDVSAVIQVKHQRLIVGGNPTARMGKKYPVPERSQGKERTA